MLKFYVGLALTRQKGESKAMQHDLLKLFIRNSSCSLVLACTLLIVGCSDDAKPKEPFINDAGLQLWPCDVPGESCNAHNACAINPVCGEDRYCHPTALQNCDDGLDCTNDSCAGQGLCDNTPKSGFCALLIKGTDTNPSSIQCITEGTRNPDDPCKICDPTQDSLKWSGADGGSCNDGNNCTKDDYCKDGFCEGVYFGNECSDGYTCTDDICDGKGGCSNILRADSCIINDKCYKEGEASEDGCSICDPTKDNSAWTPRTVFCKIGNHCYGEGEHDPSGCGICDPNVNDQAWSAETNTCLINDVCYQQGELNAEKCASCEPSKSTTMFTALANKCFISGVCYDSGATNATGCGQCDPTKPSDWTAISTATATTEGFESGLNGYTPSAANGAVKWQSASILAYSGNNSLYYGDVSKENYDNGAANSGSVTSPAVTLPSGQHASLSFWLYLDVEASDGFDVLTVSANGTELWKKSSTTFAKTQYKQWTNIEIDLSSFAGQSISFTFNFSTTDDWANTGKGVAIDDITLTTNCGTI